MSAREKMDNKGDIFPQRTWRGGGGGGGGARNEYCFYKIYIEFEQLNWLAILTPKHKLLHFEKCKVCC